MLSPVDFISGPLFTLWNLLKEKTGCLMAILSTGLKVGYFIVT
jgi:hypothetical protein